MFGRGRKIAPYLFISPFFVGYAIFFLYPVIQSLQLSFYRQVGLTNAPRFIGFDNYVRLVNKDPLFIKALANTTYYALGSILIIVPLALLLALILHSPKLRFRELFRFLYFTPNITAGVVVGIIFGLVFEEQYGLINNLLLAPLGGENVRWLREARWIMPAVIILGAWKWNRHQRHLFHGRLAEYPAGAQGGGAGRWRHPLASLLACDPAAAAPDPGICADHRHHRLLQSLRGASDPRWTRRRTQTTPA